jgi:hypothetical protein
MNVKTRARIAGPLVILAVALGLALFVATRPPTRGLIGVPVGAQMCQQAHDEGWPPPDWCTELLDDDSAAKP